MPLAEADIRIWGFPAGSRARQRTIPQRLARATRPAARAKRAELRVERRPEPASSALPIVPADRSTRRPARAPLEISIDVDHLPGRNATPPTPRRRYPATTGCYEQTFDPVFNATLTSDAADSPSGLEMQLKATQFLGLANSPSSLRSATLILPEGISINPDAADGQTVLPRRAGELRQPGPRPPAPTTRRSAPSTSRRRRSTGR